MNLFILYDHKKSHRHFLTGKYAYLELEDSSESEDMIGEYLGDMPCFPVAASNTLTSIELAMSK